MTLEISIFPLGNVLAESASTEAQVLEISAQLSTNQTCSHMAEAAPAVALLFQSDYCRISPGQQHHSTCQEKAQLLLKTQELGAMVSQDNAAMDATSSCRL